VHPALDRRRVLDRLVKRLAARPELLDIRRKVVERAFAKEHF
jgi:hypothetical protein